ETAEMPDMYGPGEYDLAGFTVGAVEKSQLRDGARVEAGDVLVGIASSGPHSNGYSLIRRIYERAGRPTDVEVGGVPLLDALMAPTRLYVKPVLELLRGEHGGSVHAMAHITGGGLSENIIRVVPDGLGLDIDAAAIVLPPVFEWLQREGAVEDAEMWRTFNCGIGFVLVAPPAGAAAIEAELDRMDLPNRRIGTVVVAGGGGRGRIARPAHRPGRRHGQRASPHRGAGLRHRQQPAGRHRRDRRGAGAGTPGRRVFRPAKGTGAGSRPGCRYPRAGGPATRLRDPAGFR